MLSAKYLQITMMSQLTSLVPVFDGQNYNLWAQPIKAFLMSQGRWGYVDGSITAPGAGTPAEEIAAWQHSNDMAKGNIILCLTTPLQQFAENITTAEDMWTQLFEHYGAVSVLSIYKDFKEAITLHFNPNQHPGPNFGHLAVAFNHLSAITFGTAPNVTNLCLASQFQVFIAMAALPAKWEMLIPIICQAEDLEDLNLSIVCQAVIAQYETEGNHGQHQQKGAAKMANKITAVKCKCNNPCFMKQGGQKQPSTLQGTSNQQQPHRQCGGRGSGNAHKGKGKGKQTQGHSHVASVAVLDLPMTHIASDASLPSPTTHTVTHIGLSVSQTPKLCDTKCHDPDPNPDYLGFTYDADYPSYFFED